MRIKHAHKVKLARKLRTRQETSYGRNPDGSAMHEGLFDTKGWEKRKAAISARVARKTDAQHKNALLRRQEARKKLQTA